LIQRARDEIVKLRAEREASRIMVGIKSLTERTRAEALEDAAW